MIDFNTFAKYAQKCGKFGQKIVAKGFKKLPKVQKSPNLVTLSALLVRKNQTSPGAIRYPATCTSLEFSNIHFFNFSESQQTDSPLPKSKDEKKSSASTLGRGNRKRKPRKFFDEETSGLRTSATASPSSENPKQRRLSSGKSSSSVNARPSQNFSLGAKIPRNGSDCPEQSVVRSQVFKPGKEF